MVWLSLWPWYRLQRAALRASDVVRVVVLVFQGSPDTEHSPRAIALSALSRHLWRGFGFRFTRLCAFLHRFVLATYSRTFLPVSSLRARLPRFPTTVKLWGMISPLCASSQRLSPPLCVLGLSALDTRPRSSPSLRFTRYSRSLAWLCIGFQGSAPAPPLGGEGVEGGPCPCGLWVNPSSWSSVPRVNPFVKGCYHTSFVWISISFAYDSKSIALNRIFRACGGMAISARF